MRAVLYLGFIVAVLVSLVIADHHGDHGKKGEHKDDHSKKGDHHHPQHHSTETLACHKIAPGNTKLAFNLFRQMTTDHPSENIVISPLSISTALALLSLGAKANTHDQIIHGMSFNLSETSEKEIHDGFHHLLDMLNDADSELHLDSGNALFISQNWKILDQFLDDAKNQYRSEAFSVDFHQNEEAKKQINSYVEKKTNSKIPEAVSSVDKDAAMLLLNFIYFRGKWQSPFEEKFTVEKDFHVDDQKTVKVPFMSKTSFYQVAFLEDATMVSIPYKGNGSALFILPKEGKMKEVEADLLGAVYKFKQQAEKDLLRLQLPKFSASGSVDLKEALSKLGITDMFSDAADLSGITGAPNLKISKALHKAKLSIDEKGTEAAAVTVMEAIPMRLPPSVVFDHPFIGIIYSHLTRTSIFMFKVVNPTI
ncbi:alpha-1-antiproteinase-like [Hyperolius riggenbachi]|uniref:alpha-1-antiproteinase-like n=1 Tax=Hyperolius riggenbachi TaxID=752182 RepID=UPI0035A3C12C